MRLVMFDDGNGVRLGVLDADQIADVASVSRFHDVLSCCDAGLAALPDLANLARSAPKIAAGRAKLHAPIPRPRRNIFCVGKNYHEHAREFHASGFDSTSTSAVPDLPIVFTKASNSVSGPGDVIPAWIDPTQSVDYEGELALVMGPSGRGIAKSDAMRAIYGYTIVNDVTSRTIQNAHKQWFLGKSMDGFCPMGPAVVTADEIPDPAALRLRTEVNGELRQNAEVSDLIFDIPTLIETISRSLTLDPGDIIATGTPVGVGIGFTPPKFLQKGDVVSITIEPIGTLTNPVE
ncbi:MAG: fumarylacetoacetate hydrolase family protein [Hyphomicrobiales bacterium]|nr:fumarylacetoacetate hydrolase family protein [Hyphomicrobiales bacterium]